MSETHEYFAEQYIDTFMEVLVLGCSGGLYNDVIEIIEGNEGIFNKSDILKFIRFQHGDRSYSSVFGSISEDELIDNIEDTAKALLARVDTEWYGKQHYTTVAPTLIKNTKYSLAKIIVGE